MVALDTNVLVRYIAQDDAGQSAVASRFIETELSERNRGFISLVALLETVWVMESRYAADAQTIADITQDLLQASTLQVQDSAAVGQAITRYRQGGVDLQDCLITSLAAQRGAEVVTLDARAAKRLGMRLLR